MKLYKHVFWIAIVLISNISFGQTPNIDVQHYTNNITVSDNNDSIVGISDIEILFTKAINTFSLDLINVKEDGKGMTVSKVSENGEPVTFTHDQDKLNINVATTTIGQIRTYKIHYAGIPADGLIISKNKYDDRTFFGDNWPNRARNWIPCIDHPSDKAFVTFKVTAPSHYQVIANGMLTEETNLSNGNTFYIWKTNVTIPTKVMVIGIAKFAVDHLGEIYNVAVSIWVYPQNKEEGFYDYAQAKGILEYFIDNVGHYPYQKLSNVQSKTQFGGMENASNIFYFENSVTGARNHEDLIAHEIAHQWFGNSATEIDWPHLWLSEGFATYFTDLYVQHIYGNDAFNKRMISEKLKVLNFAKKKYTPVVDFETIDYMKLLNPNSYEKGGWVLHMLRKKIGDEMFWESIRKYYETYKFSNASTENLRHIFEMVSNQDLGVFFNQWLFTAGHPELAIEKLIEEKTLLLSITQKQKNEYTFVFPLEVKLIYNDNTEELKTINISKRNETFTIPLRMSLKEIVYDPNIWLLFENVSEE